MRPPSYTRSVVNRNVVMRRIPVIIPLPLWRQTFPLKLKNKNQLDVTYYFIVLLIGSTCFGHYYAHHQKLPTIMFITTFFFSFFFFRMRAQGICPRCTAAV